MAGKEPGYGAVRATTVFRNGMTITRFFAETRQN